MRCTWSKDSSIWKGVSLCFATTLIIISLTSDRDTVRWSLFFDLIFEGLHVLFSVKWWDHLSVCSKYCDSLFMQMVSLIIESNTILCWDSNDTIEACMCINKNNQSHMYRVSHISYPILFPRRSMDTEVNCWDLSGDQALGACGS